MNKVILFTSSHISWGLIFYLIETKRLVAVIVTPNPFPQFEQMIAFIRQNNINVYLEPTEKKEDFFKFLKDLNADIALSFLYGNIFPKEIINIYPERIFNIHPSFLPNYKGPQPLYWQIKEGVEQSAISIHKVTKDIDSGDIAKKFEFKILKDETIGALINKVTQIVPGVVHEFLEDLESDKLKYEKQDEGRYYKAPGESDLTIDWKEDSSLEISQKAKASNPIYGGVRTSIKDSLVQILQTTPSNKKTYGVKEGVIVLIDQEEGLIVATKDGALKIDVVSSIDGIFSGYSYANFIKVFSGDSFR